MATKKTKARKATATKTAARNTVGNQAAKRERGRPSVFSEELCKAICGWIKQGYTLRQIEALPNMPTKSTIIRWLGEHDEFCDQYARAREIQALVMVDELMEIADDSRNDWIERENKDGQLEIAFNSEAVQRSKLRSDTRKWLMGKMAPKRFGDKMQVTGKDGGAIEHQHKRDVAKVLDDIDGAGTGLPAHDRRG